MVYESDSDSKLKKFYWEVSAVLKFKKKWLSNSCSSQNINDDFGRAFFFDWLNFTKLIVLNFDKIDSLEVCNQFLGVTSKYCNFIWNSFKFVYNWNMMNFFFEKKECRSIFGQFFTNFSKLNTLKYAMNTSIS